MRRRDWLAGGLSSAVLAGQAIPARAQKSVDTLRISLRDLPADLDFYHNPLRTGFVLSLHVWDGLVYRDPETFQIKPLLAAAYRLVDDTTIDFDLRPYVKFHNGDTLSAADVVYTIQNILNDTTLSVPSNYEYLAGAEKLDDLKVRVKLKRVFPAALEYIAMVLPIWPKSYREQVGPAGYARAPIGTGPYKFASIDPLNQIMLERFDDYLTGGPKGKPAIGRIAIQPALDSQAEVSALLSGLADWIWDFSSEQFDKIAAVPSLQAVRAETMRVAYLSMDASGRTGEANPLTNEKVRKAISHAIDRASMVRDLVQGSSRTLDTPCFPSQFGCNQVVAVRYPYDPGRARQLLTEAGFPNGFSTRLVSYLLPPWTAAVQGYLAAVGISASIQQLATAPAIATLGAAGAPLFMGSWGSYSINDASAFMPYFFGGGPEDIARDPDVTALVEQGGGTRDPDQRRKAYTEAIRRITSGAYWLPLFTVVRTYGFSRQLLFRPSPDELPRFYLSSWK